MSDGKEQNYFEGQEAGRFNLLIRGDQDERFRSLAKHWRLKHYELFELLIDMGGALITADSLHAWWVEKNQPIQRERTVDAEQPTPPVEPELATEPVEVDPNQTDIEDVIYALTDDLVPADGSDLEVGKTYTVTSSGTQYECVADEDGDPVLRALGEHPPAHSTVPDATEAAPTAAAAQ
ncbi:MAG: hypothetical protein VXW22_16670 [Pseudomonadota bacterium]|nr:hypothetical protein [Pseudomonadota bacterium]